VLGYFWLDTVSHLLPYVLVLAASSFIYIALADLVPDMQKRRTVGESAIQVALLFVGIAVIAMLAVRLHAH
jgi:zinc and cadmium transporter